MIKYLTRTVLLRLGIVALAAFGVFQEIDVIVWFFSGLVGLMLGLVLLSTSILSNEDWKDLINEKKMKGENINDRFDLQATNLQTTALGVIFYLGGFISLVGMLVALFFLNNYISNKVNKLVKEMEANDND